MYLEETMSLLKVQHGGHLVLVNNEKTALLVLGDAERFKDFNLDGIACAIAIIGARCQAQTSVDEVIAVLKELQTGVQSELSQSLQKLFSHYFLK
jgi:nitrate reductase alpha subunit